MGKEITHVTIPIALVEQTLSYLSERPFREVNNLIVGLKQSADASFTAQQHAAEAESAATGSPSRRA